METLEGNVIDMPKKDKGVETQTWSRMMISQKAIATRGEIREVAKCGKILLLVQKPQLRSHVGLSHVSLVTPVITLANR